MAKIYYHATPVDWRKEQKYRFLDESGSVYGVDWTEKMTDVWQMAEERRREMKVES